MTMFMAVPTRDKPTTADGAVIVERRPKPPAGHRYEVREDGQDVITVLVATNDAPGQPPTRAALEQQNREALALVSAGSGAQR